MLLGPFRKRDRTYFAWFKCRSAFKHMFQCFTAAHARTNAHSSILTMPPIWQCQLIDRLDHCSAPLTLVFFLFIKPQELCDFFVCVHIYITYGFVWKSTLFIAIKFQIPMYSNIKTNEFYLNPFGQMLLSDVFLFQRNKQRH